MSDEEAKLAEAESTRQRILEAAEAEFAEKGFTQATVREILRRAGVGNIAAVNYHFGDKERLYIEAVKSAHQSCSSIPFPTWPAGVTPAQKMREFIRVLAERMLKPVRVSATKLMMREIADPSQACTEVVRDYIQPMAEVLRGILNELVPGMPPEKINLIGFSIVSQCLFYRQNRSIVERLTGKETLDRLTPELLADHVAGFTLAALGGKP
jgi:AcrR family transcriptional regulator